MMSNSSNPFNEAQTDDAPENEKDEDKPQILEAGSYPKYSGNPQDDFDRVPPPQVFFYHGTQNTNNSQNEVTPSEHTPLYMPRNQSIPKYRDHKTEYTTRDKTFSEAVKLISFWACLIGLLLSSIVLGCSAYNLFLPEIESKVIITSVLGCLLSLSAWVKDCCQLLALLRNKPSQGQYFKITAYHKVICCLSVLPYIQNCRVTALLFVSHIIPVILCQVAQLRRESQYTRGLWDDEYF